jgi:hypothetical protein
LGSIWEANTLVWHAGEFISAAVGPKGGSGGSASTAVSIVAKGQDGRFVIFETGVGRFNFQSV